MIHDSNIKLFVHCSTNNNIFYISLFLLFFLLIFDFFSSSSSSFPWRASRSRCSWIVDVAHIVYEGSSPLFSLLLLLLLLRTLSYSIWFSLDCNNLSPRTAWGSKRKRIIRCTHTGTYMRFYVENIHLYTRFYLLYISYNNAGIGWWVKFYCIYIIEDRHNECLAGKYMHSKYIHTYRRKVTAYMVFRCFEQRNHYSRMQHELHALLAWGLYYVFVSFCFLIINTSHYIHFFCLF